MKKKVGILLFAFFVLPLSIFLVSCGEKKQEPSYDVSNIIVDVENEHFNQDNRTFYYTYGEEVEIEKTNFTVKLIYSDSSVEPTILTQDEFTFDTSSIEKNEENKVPYGYYTISITYTANPVYNETFNVVVNRQVIDNFYIEENYENAFTYDGSSKDIVSYIESLDVPEGMESLGNLLSYNKVRIEEVEDTQATNAGQYFFYIYANDNYIFENDQTYKLVNWSIDKQVVTAYVEQTEFEYIYDENFESVEQELTIEWSIDNPGEVVDIYNNKNRYVGQNECFASIKTGEASNNYKFVDENGNEIYNYNIATWTINPAKLAKPIFDVESGYEFVYNTEVQKPTVSISDETAKFFNIVYSDANSTAAGYYNISVQKASIDIGIYDNFVWENTDQKVEDFDFPYTILKAPYYELPDDFNTKIVAQKTFYFTDDGEYISIYLDRYNDLTDDTIEYMQNNNLLSDFTTFVLDESVKIKEAGVYENVPAIYCKDNYNYENQNVTITVIIDKLDISVNPQWQKDYQYERDVYSLDRTDSLSNELVDFYAREELNISQVGETTYLYRASETDEWEETSERLNAGEYKTKIEVEFNDNCNIVIAESCINGSEIINENGKTYILAPWSIEKVANYPSIAWRGTNHSFSISDEIFAFETGENVTLEAETYGFNVNYTLSHKYFYKENKNDFYPEQSTDDLSKVGYYKTIATATFDNVNGYIVEDELQPGCILDENTLTWEKEWEILPATIDLAGTSWVSSAAITYGTEYDPYNYITNLPECVLLEIWYYNPANWSSSNYKVESVGNYYIYAVSVSANNLYEGYENVSIINTENFLNESGMFTEGNSFLYITIEPLTLTEDFLLEKVQIRDSQGTWHVVQNRTINYTEGETYTCTLSYWNLNETEEHPFVYEGTTEASEIGEYSYTVTIPKEACSGNVTFEGDTLSLHVTWYIV